MAFIVTDQTVGSQPIADTSSVKKHPVGTVVRATDPTYGEGEFVYLIGVASTIVGSIVSYVDGDTLVGQTALATTAVDSGEPLAVAMSANLAAGYGWYQISGVAVLGKANTLSLAPAADFAVASGLVIAADTTNRVSGANTSITASASALVITVPCVIDRPCGPGVG
tara:strand:+ start:2015 stop:2515 length:501 start_codon:yes stop_codon:yes gene_type:complete